jgi:hypothetical protein
MTACGGVVSTFDGWYYAHNGTKRGDHAAFSELRDYVYCELAA